MKTIGLILIGLLCWITWVVSIPFTLLVILLDLARDNADWVYTSLDVKVKEARPTIDKAKSFEQKLKERMEATKTEREAALAARKNRI